MVQISSLSKKECKIASDFVDVIGALWDIGAKSRKNVFERLMMLHMLTVEEVGQIRAIMYRTCSDSEED